MLLLLLTSSPVRADVPARIIVVLKAELSDAERWERGTQAAVAELLTTGFELEVRAARSRHTSSLKSELAEQVSAERSAAVVVFRRGQRGLAWVYDHRFGFEQLEVDAAGGPIAQSRFVLRIVELLRNVEIPAGAAPTPPTPTPVPPSPPITTVRQRPPLRLWLAAGVTLSSGLAPGMPWLTGSASVGISPLLAAEATFGTSPGNRRVSSQDGQLSLQARQLSSFIMFDPFAHRSFGMAMGLGGGGVWAHGEGQGAPGYVGREASTFVSLLSARGRVFFTWKSWHAQLTVDPGVLIPSVEVTSAGEQVLQLGRPWLSVTAGMGVNL